MENTESIKWYDKKALVYFLLIIFFPLGLYALWKNRKISMISKGVVTVVVAFIVVVCVMRNTRPDEATNEITEKVSSKTVTAKKEVKEKDFQDDSGWAWGMQKFRFGQLVSEYKDNKFDLKSFNEASPFQGKRIFIANFNNSAGVDDTFALALEKASDKGLEKSKFKIVFFGRSYFGGGAFEFRNGFGTYISNPAIELSINLHNEILKKSKSSEKESDVITMAENMKDCKVEVIFAGLKGGTLIRNVRIFEKDFDWQRDILRASVN